MPHPSKLPKTTKHPVDTITPPYATSILGWWQDDPDPRPQEVRLYITGWRILQKGAWYDCVPPTHWTPIT